MFLMLGSFSLEICKSQGSGMTLRIKKVSLHKSDVPLVRQGKKGKRYHGSSISLTRDRVIVGLEGCRISHAETEEQFLPNTSFRKRVAWFQEPPRTHRIIVLIK